MIHTTKDERFSRENIKIFKATINREIGDISEIVDLKPSNIACFSSIPVLYVQSSMNVICLKTHFACCGFKCFLILYKKLKCGYSSEATLQGTSNVYIRYTVDSRYFKLQETRGKHKAKLTQSYDNYF